MILNGERRNIRMMIDNEKTVRMIWTNSTRAFKKKKTKTNGTSCLIMMRLLMKMTLSQITLLIDLQLLSSFQMRRELIRKHKLSMRNYLILNWKLNPFYKFLLVNALKQLELKWLRNGNFHNLMNIDENSFKLKKLSSWKHKDLKLLETEEEERLKEELFNIEQLKSRNIEEP